MVECDGECCHQVTEAKRTSNASSRAYYMRRALSRSRSIHARVLVLNNFNERHTTPTTTTTIRLSKDRIGGRRHYPRCVLPSNGLPGIVILRHIAVPFDKPGH